MKLLGMICVVAAIDIVILGGAEAVPLSTLEHLSAKLLENLNTRKHSADEDTDLGIVKVGNNRPRRSSSLYHDYEFTAFTLQNEDWRPNKCDSMFNCEKVSPHYCSNSRAQMFDVDCEVENSVSGCELEFNIYIDNGEVARGVDFAMFKKTDQAVEDVYYNTYFIYKLPSNVYTSVSERSIPASCSGWQVFHVHDDLVKTLQNGQNNFKLVLAVFKASLSQSATELTCDEIKQSFFLDNKTVDFDFGTYGSNTPLNRQVRDTDNNEVPTVNGISTDTKEEKITGQQETTAEEETRLINDKTFSKDRFLPLVTVFVMGE